MEGLISIPQMMSMSMARKQESSTKLDESSVRGSGEADVRKGTAARDVLGDINPTEEQVGEMASEIGDLITQNDKKAVSSCIGSSCCQ